MTDSLTRYEQTMQELYGDPNYCELCRGKCRYGTNSCGSTYYTVGFGPIFRCKLHPNHEDDHDAMTNGIAGIDSWAKKEKR